MGDKIQILRKTPTAVTPADSRTALKYKEIAFRTCIDMLKKNQLEKLRAADISFSICFHSFNL